MKLKERSKLLKLKVQNMNCTLDTEDLKRLMRTYFKNSFYKTGKCKFNA